MRQRTEGEGCALFAKLLTKLTGHWSFQTRPRFAIVLALPSQLIRVHLLSTSRIRPVDFVVQASVDLLVWARIPLLPLTFPGWSVLVMSAFAGTRTTFPAGAAAPILALYPLSLLGIAGLETYLGWH